MRIFALTIFAGAFLLFQVQPLIAKFILPWFGGGPGVWTTCMLFFQVFLLGGYAYAHLTSRFFSPRVQAGLHWILLAAALVLLPIQPAAHWKPSPGGDPTGHILLLLTVCLGLPYFALSATGPLLQAWFSRLQPGAAPYRLYALSNIGSLLALLSYPFVFEPILTRRAQAILWSCSFGVFALLCGGCAWRLWRSNPAPAFRSDKNGRTGNSLASAPPPALPTQVLWFALPACGSVLLLATTNKLCLDVAAIPFLWILPLSLYLLTFILCFDRPAWYVRKTFTLLLIPFLGLACYALFQGSRLPLLGQIIIYCGTMFICCMVCHGEVCRLQPPPRFLTSFYLLIAAGGAAGGIWVAAVAPRIFNSYAELNWGFVSLAALLLILHAREKTTWRVAARPRPLWPALLTGMLVLAAALFVQSLRAAQHAIFTSRNFYGVLRVFDLLPGNPRHAFKLNHGDIVHGLQFTDPVLATTPTTYYDESSGVGLALDNFPRQANRRVGLVGLGTGTLAAYGRRGDTFRFYEINPEVVRLAGTDFNFLMTSRARVEVVPGDARLSLENESPQQFDLLVLDAFSSDAIPVHLLTQEAFTDYFRHLKPDGVIAVHISNRHLDLLPVVAGAAKHFQLLMIEINRKEDPASWWVYPSNWVLLSRNHDFMYSPAIMSKASMMPDQAAANSILWTDDYASLFPIVRR
jgi:SAM-dependent methyltransferase